MKNPLFFLCIWGLPSFILNFLPQQFSDSRLQSRELNIKIKLICHRHLRCKSFKISAISGEQGWRSGESTRLPPMWPGFDSRTWRHMWVEFVVGSRLCSERFFTRYSGFSLSSKTNTSKFQFDLESVPN